jgi:hypothetical protein
VSAAIHADGFAIWKVKSNWNTGHPAHELTLHDLVAITPEAHAALSDEHRNRSGLLKPRIRVDVVEVSPKVSLREAYGVDRKTGKRSKVLAVVFEATITSQVPPATYTVSESGHVSKNVEVSKRFAKQVKQVILEKIGPNIPAQ